MIIKKNLKSQMPSLKRCKFGDSEEDESSGRKKRRTNGYYPLNLLGEVAAGIIPVSFRGLLGSVAAAEKGGGFSWCTEVSCSPPPEEEAESKSKVCKSAKGKAEVSRPPLVRTSRGRVQVLPSRFNDSVIENWKKESKTSLRGDSNVEDEKPSLKPQKNGKKLGNNVYGSKKYSGLCEEEEEEEEEEEDEDGYVPFKSYNMRKYNSSSRSTLTSVHEHLVEDDKCAVVEIIEEEEEEDDLEGAVRISNQRTDGLYGPEDFYSGDIVWAKPGKKEPFWPAIVIDPMTQAPELV
ncbi:putative histone-lysine N-methyltransferase [Rosa chinensis]|uniref:Putative histone-lysine N-methyltransferase n=1 Tax=Rosa chinensis TaxID=74649 RepID=A0A2P6SP14_ROSCH|nr:putative histone-lysine N-methyltransferase [Rosa chinensis]